MNARPVIFIASYIAPALVERIRAAAPAYETIYRPDLLATPRYSADHNAPVQRSPEQEAEWRQLLGRAEILFDFDFHNAAELPYLAPRGALDSGYERGHRRVRKPPPLRGADRLAFHDLFGGTRQTADRIRAAGDALFHEGRAGFAGGADGAALATAGDGPTGWEDVGHHRAGADRARDRARGGGAGDAGDRRAAGCEQGGGGRGGALPAVRAGGTVAAGALSGPGLPTYGGDGWADRRGGAGALAARRGAHQCRARCSGGARGGHRGLAQRGSWAVRRWT